MDYWIDYENGETGWRIVKLDSYGSMHGVLFYLYKKDGWTKELVEDMIGKVNDSDL